MLRGLSGVVLILGLLLANVSGLYNDNSEPDTHFASINVTVCNLDGSSCKSHSEEATYGSSSSHRKVEGYLIYAAQGCQKFNFPVKRRPWIALIERGKCFFTNKIENAENHNASGVIVYGATNDVFKMGHENNPDFVAVSITNSIAKKILSEINNSSIYVKIAFDRTVQGRKMNTISVLFVSVSFIVLMVISLAWLVFYYVQRFRFLYARDKTEVRKALSSPYKSVFRKCFLYQCS